MVKPFENIIYSNTRQMRMINSVPHRFLTKSSFNHKGERYGRIGGEGELWMKYKVKLKSKQN